MVMQKVCGEPVEDVRDESALGAAIRGLSQPWDIKAFKGKGAFRSLAARHRNIVGQLQQEMEALSLDTERVNAGCFLRLVCESGRSARLRWCVRGQPSFYVFAGLRDLMATLSPRVAEFFKAADERAGELALLESIHRSAAKRIQDFLRPAPLSRVSGGRAQPAAQTVSPVNATTRTKVGVAASARGLGKPRGANGPANRSRTYPTNAVVRMPQSTGLFRD